LSWFDKLLRRTRHKGNCEYWAKQRR
jgi:hypothetical protein